MLKKFKKDYLDRHIKIQKILNDRFSNRGIETVIKHNELTVNLSKSLLLQVLSFLRDDKDFFFKQLIDICGVDFPEREKRFEVVYHFANPASNQRLRLKTLALEFF